MNELVPAAAEQSLAIATQAAAEFAEQASSRATRRAYASCWRHFDGWCTAHYRDALPADALTVAAYVGALAEAKRRPSTIQQRLAAIGYFHRRHNYPNPAAHAGVKAALEGIRRTRGAAPSKKAALTVELIERLVALIALVDAKKCSGARAELLAGLRDRALILLGFAGALRRSELVALTIADVARHPKGIVLAIRKSKTDQAGEGRVKAIPHGERLHVVAALDAWLDAAGIADGPLFRRLRGEHIGTTAMLPGEVARIIKKRAQAAGLDPKVFSGHSLRSGYITSASDHGAKLQDIANHAGHEKLDTTRGYMHVSDAFRNHSGEGFL
jgi:site-specific recombinase XerD